MEGVGGNKWKVVVHWVCVDIFWNSSLSLCCWDPASCSSRCADWGPEMAHGSFEYCPGGSGPTAECSGDFSPGMDVGMGGWDYMVSWHVLCARRSWGLPFACGVGWILGLSRFLDPAFVGFGVVRWWSGTVPVGQCVLLVISVLGVLSVERLCCCVVYLSVVLIPAR